ncbi:hypothetical protein HRS9139_04112 [Pyrenophora teres f. teres]|nr:hypothetical protein HRS9139_04112 [Pyrenophora teres f. teres]
MVRYTLENLARVPKTLADSVRRTRAEVRQLGKSGLRISNPILGGAHVGDSRWLPWTLNRDQALPLLKAAYDRGINTWDTANVYSNGDSERIMAEAMRLYQIPRRKLVLMTKCYRVVCDDEAFDAGSGVTMHQDLALQSKDYMNQSGLSRTAIFHAVEASLERLQTSYIDVLHIHRYDDTVAPEETMLALHDLVRSGRVRYIGASSMWTYQFATLQFTAERNGWTKFVSMQNHYNLLYREEEREMIRFCRENGVGLIPWSPFAAGRLVRSSTLCQPSIRSSLSTTGDIYDIEGSDCDTVIARVHEIAAQPPIIGFSSIDRMDEALSARGLRLSPEEENYLEEAYQAKAIIGHE